jgi:putative PIN family toxin of toxin-antitoxin system
MKRIVLDTNVTISALFWRGYPRVIYDLVREGKLTLLTSIKIEREFIKVMAYSRFGLTPTEVLPIVNSLRKYVHFIEIKSKVDAVKEDPTDNIFLECALDGDADYIVSGDHHLLNIGSYKGIPIVRAKDFLTKEGLI